MDFGDAVERALPEFRELRGKVLAAEDAALAEPDVDLLDVLARAIEIDDELLEEAGRERDPYAVDAVQRPRRVVRLADDQVADLAEALRPSSAM